MNHASDLARHWLLDPEVVFLNHGSFGACPVPVLEYQQRLRERLERQPVRFLVRELEGLLDEVRTELAAFLHVRPLDLVFVSNATTGVNAVLRSLPLGAGDEVLITDNAYLACRNALDFVARVRGATVVVAHLPFPLRDPHVVTEAIAGSITPRTRLAVLDHVTSPTGLVQPLEEVMAVLNERGVDVLVDGAHAPGMLDLDVSAVGATYYTGNCHKWLCAPKGAAFLWVHPERQQLVRPLVTSHGASSTRTDRQRMLLEFDWVGTDDPTAVLSIGAALRFMGSLWPGGWRELRERNRALTLQARDTLCAALEIDPPAPDSMIGSLAAVPLPPGKNGAPPSALYADALHDRLLERWNIEVPVIPWPKFPSRLLRIAAQVYNSPAQYELLASALRTLRSEGLL